MIERQTRITNMGMFGVDADYEMRMYEDWGRPVAPEEFYCCKCMDHETGECMKERARLEWIEELKRAIVRSSGGISRQGFLR